MQVKIPLINKILTILLWNYNTPGIPDELFERNEEVPITKEDVRSIVISKLRLKNNSSAIDVGCGSGSITVELCLQARSGKIYGIDFNEKAIELTKINLKKFGVNAELVLAKAQDVLPSLPEVDSIIIGGTGGNVDKVIELCIGKLKKGGRLVIDTILIETTYKALNLIDNARLDEVDVTQVTVAKAKKVTSGTMLLARNPVLLISATKP
ncbi:MAG TPA: precorrin-6Y C5,15-methyltransferase (decarboxylating) subunit CbiT [Nitrososphaeraceae archaeon]|nr:precorrin-6Y C5,15-methyltransferase (decarboxylating) subunit CbiT [Nitrososphaeraceae archaeon]